jgi:plasmid stability protein
MATLYVENVPDDLYEALRKQASRKRTSISAEVIGLLRQWVPTPAELRRREKIFKALQQLRKRKPLHLGPFPSAEEMLREDRER